MATSTFDTLSVARELEAKGIEPGQAEAIVKAIRRSAGDHMSAGQFDARFSEQRTYIDGRFSEQRAYIDGRFSEQQTYIDGRFSEQRTDIDGRFSEQRAYIDTGLARQSAVFYRALWLQGAAIISVLAALYALVGGG